MGHPAARRLALLYLEDGLLDMQGAFTNRMIAADPKGFSTTRHDLIHDLIP